MMEAALFQLRAALTDDPAFLELRIGANVLAGAVSAAKDGGLNAARVNDIEFALNDLVAASEGGVPDAVHAAIGMLQQDVVHLRAAAALPPDLVDSIRSLQAKLRTRKTAIERSQYRAEDAPETELPHPPEELREEAIPLARKLAAAGFDTPALDMLVADPDSLRYHSVAEIIDELEVIGG